MARRVSLPAADDLFRPTQPVVRAVEDGETADNAEESGPRRTSGRVRHDEKMTVYVTADELLHLEQARLTLRSRHGYAVDRGRLVREALAIVLADFEENADDSVLVRRLSQG